MVKLYSCLIGMAASRPSESRQLLAKEAMKSATLEPCATFILQHWDSASVSILLVLTNYFIIQKIVHVRRRRHHVKATLSRRHMLRYALLRASLWVGSRRRVSSGANEQCNWHWRMRQWAVLRGEETGRCIWHVSVDCGGKRYNFTCEMCVWMCVLKDWSYDDDYWTVLEEWIEFKLLELGCSRTNTT